VNVVVLKVAPVVDTAFPNTYVPFKEVCPSAPVIVTRFWFKSVQATSEQSPGLTYPPLVGSGNGDCSVTTALVPAFTIEINCGKVGSESPVARSFSAPIVPQ
jgi:hypothetical protein